MNFCTNATGCLDKYVPEMDQKGSSFLEEATEQQIDENRYD